MTTPTVIIERVARENRGRYLISWSTWRDPDHPTRKACEELVNAGKARWLDPKRFGEPGEPGPGIRLIDG